MYRRSISNSELSSFCQCRLKWWFEYKQMLTPKVKNVKLRVGNGVHDTIANTLQGKEFSADNFKKELWKECIVSGEQPTDEQKQEELVWLKYAEKVSAEIKEEYKNDTVLFTEMQGKTVIPGAKLVYWYKIDGGVIKNNANWIIENKTTASFNNDFLFNLQINNQPTGYLWAANKKEQEKYVGILYNILVKPPAQLKDKIAWIEKNKLLHVEFITRSQDDINEWLDMMKHVAKDTKNSGIYRTPEQHCSWMCSYKSLCLTDSKEQRELLYRKKRQKYEQYEKEKE